MTPKQMMDKKHELSEAYSEAMDEFGKYFAEIRKVLEAKRRRKEEAETEETQKNGAEPESGSTPDSD